MTGWLDRLLGWLGAIASADQARRDAAEPKPAQDAYEAKERSDRERELELRVFMSTWM